MLRRLCLCGGAILLVVSTAPCLRGEGRHEALPRDDGWRRTAEGWEIMHTQPVPASTSSAQSSALHPLLLAALQATLVTAAYWRFPVKK